jgi:hypothetical protein
MCHKNQRAPEPFREIRDTHPPEFSRQDRRGFVTYCVGTTRFRRPGRVLGPEPPCEKVTDPISSLLARRKHRAGNDVEDAGAGRGGRTAARRRHRRVAARGRRAEPDLAATHRTRPGSDHLDPTPCTARGPILKIPTIWPWADTVLTAHQRLTTLPRWPDTEPVDLETRDPLLSRPPPRHTFVEEFHHPAEPLDELVRHGAWPRSRRRPVLKPDVD